jgi:hypothetical protein
VTKLRNSTEAAKKGEEVVVVALNNRCHYKTGSRQHFPHGKLINAHFHLKIECLARAGLFAA